MKQKIAFIAVGQAGGNIGQLFEQKGFSVLYVNTSREDLETLDKAKFKYHIQEGEGCNKDRHKAKQLLIDDYDQIAAEIDSKIKAELIFVIFSSGGGTGSGAGPMLIDLLLDEGHAAGAVTIVPGLEESVKSHINAYECFRELTALDPMAACFILDNEKEDKLSLNEQFAEAFTAFLRIPENHKSVKGNIDKAEIVETLKAHGMSYVLCQPAGESAGFMASIQDHMYADMEADRAVKYIAVSLGGNVLLSDIEKAVGTPVDTFVTYNEEQTVCCLSGLTFPQSRLDLVFQKVSENREVIKKNLTATKETALKADVNFLEELELAEMPKEKKKPQSKRDIMSKYL